jgi:hypothetical protein
MKIDKSGKIMYADLAGEAGGDKETLCIWPLCVSVILRALSGDAGDAREGKGTVKLRMA